MSNAEIIAMIDAVLALPVADSTKAELRTYQSQVQAGRLHPDDRNYVVALCYRLTRRSSEHSPELLDTRKHERSELDARRPSRQNPYSRIVQNVAVFSRTGLVLLTAWIVLRLTWPNNILDIRLADLTIGVLISSIFWFGISLCTAMMLFSFGVMVPERAKQDQGWCGLWNGLGIIVLTVYAGAFYLLTQPAKGSLLGFAQVVALFLWWPVM